MAAACASVLAAPAPRSRSTSSCFAGGHALGTPRTTCGRKASVCTGAAPAGQGGARPLITTGDHGFAPPVLVPPSSDLGFSHWAYEEPSPTRKAPSGQPSACLGTARQVGDLPAAHPEEGGGHRHLVVRGRPGRPGRTTKSLVLLPPRPEMLRARAPLSSCSGTSQSAWEATPHLPVFLWPSDTELQTASDHPDIAGCRHCYLLSPLVDPRLSCLSVLDPGLCTQ